MAMERYFTDARVSGDHYYRGELYRGDRLGDHELVAVTHERYVTVEDAWAGARRYIPGWAQRAAKYHLCYVCDVSITAYDMHGNAKPCGHRQRTRIEVAS